jgi:hypothetical protein
MKRLSFLLVFCSLWFLVALPAWAVTPSNGVYQGIVDGSPNSNGHNEGEGYLRVKSTSAGKKIVPPGAFQCGGSPCEDDHITAPQDGFECNQLNVDLTAKSIPISAGAFDYRGDAPIGPGGATRHVHFKGAWVAGKTVKGFTRITGDGCDSGKMHWTMKTPPA